MLGFMLPTAFLSMWISNAATSAMMVSVFCNFENIHTYHRCRLFKQSSLNWHLTGFRTSLSHIHENLGTKSFSRFWKHEHLVSSSKQQTMMYLALAYSANIGGTGTIIGWYTSQTQQSMVFAQPKTKRGTFVIWYTTQTKESLVGP